MHKSRLWTGFQLRSILPKPRGSWKLWLRTAVGLRRSFVSCLLRALLGGLFRAQPAGLDRAETVPSPGQGWGHFRPSGTHLVRMACRTYRVYLWKDDQGAAERHLVPIPVGRPSCYGVDECCQPAGVQAGGSL